MRNEMIVLGNLTCPSCAAELEKALRRLAGVKRADVLFGSATVELEYDEAALSTAKIDEVIRSFGLAVASRI